MATLPTEEIDRPPVGDASPPTTLPGPDDVASPVSEMQAPEEPKTVEDKLDRANDLTLEGKQQERQGKADAEQQKQMVLARRVEAMNKICLLYTSPSPRDRG